MSSPAPTAIYISLGRYRTAAAQEYTARLAAAGTDVHLIVPDNAVWAGVGTAPGVSTYRVGATSPTAAANEAIRLLRDSAGPIPAPGLVIGGDLEALPVAWAALRRNPGAAIRFELSEDAGRRPAPADIAVVTPWYPSPSDPFNGAFVQAAVGAVGDTFGRVSILHTHEWSFPRDTPFSVDRIGIAADRIADRWGNVVVEDRPEGEVTRVSVPVLMPARDYRARSAAHVETLRRALPAGIIEAPLIHAHTGIYGGVVAQELGRDDARIVVTEHATFLPRIFVRRASRRRYGSMLERVDLLMCVGEHMYDLISNTFPSHRDKLRVVANPIDFDGFAVRPQPPGDLLRWLYLGRMTEHKGVRVLLEAFARVAGEEPRASLTLVGSGELEDDLRDRIRELEMRERVELREPVTPQEVSGVLHEHDVLVHASQMETFGSTVVEAVATGTPVLVARSEGPSETLAGLEGIAGLMFDISDDPDVIVDAYRRLRAMLPDLDMDAARRNLESRYGRQAIREKLLDVYQTETTVPAEAAAETAEPAFEPAAAEPGPGVVVVAMGSRGFGRARDYANAMLGRGRPVDLVTLDADVWRQLKLDPRVRLHPIGQRENRGLLLRGEQLLVYRVPGKAIATAIALARRQQRLGPEVAVVRARRGYRRLSRNVHNTFLQRGYSVVRPLILWRIVRRDVLPRLSMAESGRVVIADASGVAIGWRLAKRYPGVTVTTSTSVTFHD